LHRLKKYLGKTGGNNFGTQMLFSTSFNLQLARIVPVDLICCGACHFQGWDNKFVINYYIAYQEKTILTNTCLYVTSSAVCPNGKEALQKACYH